MSTIRVSNPLFQEAEVYGKAYHRSAPKQIEFWSRIGKIAEANPDLCYDDILGLLVALEEKEQGPTTDYVFSS